MNNKLLIDSLIEIDDSGMPKPPTTRNLLDRDVRELYRRDDSKDKHRYIAECMVIYYLGDPKSPARQSGLSDPEALKMAIDQAGLEKDYIPDVLVLRLIKRYYEQNITEAGKVVENLLNEKLHSTISLDEITTIMNIVDLVRKAAGDIPSTVKKLEEAKQNLMYEKETELSRGGNVVLSSMDAEDYTN